MNAASQCMLQKKEEKFMREVPFELSYRAAVDENGVIDGRDLAEGLIRDAIRMLAPYAQGCTDCSYTLFRAIAEFVILELEGGEEQLPERKMVARDGEDENRELAFYAHWQATQQKTVSIMQRVGGQAACISDWK